MKNNTIYFAFALFIFLLIVISTGCTYISKRKNLNPVETDNWSSLYNSTSKFPLLFHDCSSFKIEAHFIPFESTMYSIGPIIPIIPFYSKDFFVMNKELLEIKIILDGNLTSIDLSEDILFIERNKDSIILKPVSFEKNYGKPKEREYYSFIFNTKPENISQFKVVFTRKIGNCSVPSLVYESRDLGLELGVLSN